MCGTLRSGGSSPPLHQGGGGGGDLPSPLRERIGEGRGAGAEAMESGGIADLRGDQAEIEIIDFSEINP